MEHNGLVWFRNDLRTIDNKSLSEATATCKKVIACFCFDPDLFQENNYGFKKTDKFRAQFLIETVQELQERLDKLNIPLYVFIDSPQNKIPPLVEKHQITKIYSQKEWTTEEVATEKGVIRNLEPENIDWISHYDQFLYHPNDLNFEINKTPQVFTAFRKKLEKYVSVRPICCISNDFIQPKIENNTKVPTLKELGFEDFKVPVHTAFPFKGGEKSAFNRIEEYFWETKKLSYYKQTRNGLLGTNYSSKLSAWLANGSISAKSIYWEVKKYEKEVVKNSSTYWLIFELIWRDYFKYISLKHETAIFKLGGILEKQYSWSTNSGAITSWINGNTGKTFVDANMIELKETGWMSNRGRQNVASYFAKELQLDWRIGAAYFESMLIDYDVHSNYGNWMYVAGVGNDPRDRKFNIDSQAERYDPNGKFQQLWLQPTLF